MRNKRFLGMVVLVGVFSLLFSMPISAKKITIAWYTGGPKEASDELIQVFEKQHPNVSVEPLILGWDDMWKKLMASIAGGVPPQIVRGKEYWPATLAAKGVLFPLDEFIEKNEIFNPEDEIYIRRTKEVLTYKGKTYALPYHNFWPMLVYNEDLLKEAGLQHPPDTFAEFREYGVKLTKPEKGQWGTMLYTYTRIEPTLVLWSFFIYSLQNKARLYTKENETVNFTLNSPANVEALEWIVDSMYKYKFCVPPEKVSASMIENYRVAMWITGQFSFGGYDRTLPPDLKWKVAPVPQNQTRALFSEGNALFIPDAAENKETALEFMKFLSSDEGDMIHSKWVGVIPFRDSNWEKPPYSTLPRNIVSIDTVKKSEMAFPQYFPNYIEVMSKVAESLQAAFYGKMEPKAALDKAQQEVQEVYKESL